MARALVEFKGIHFEVVGGVFAKYAARAAINGEAFGLIVGPRVFDGCIPPYYREKIVQVSSPVLAGQREE